MLGGKLKLGRRDDREKCSYSFYEKVLQAAGNSAVIKLAKSYLEATKRTMRHTIEARLK